MNEYLIIHILLGMVVGSFISALTYRLPRGLNFVKGRSFCDSCKKELRWYDNIPLFSFLFYKGKSRCCGKKISLRYPLIELTSVIGVLIIWFLTYNIVYIILFFLTLAVFIIDLEHQIIPDQLIWIILILGILFVEGSLLVNLFPAFLISLFFLLLHLLTKGRGMGLGDVKLGIALGLWLGLSQAVIFLSLSFLTGGLIASILLFRGKAKLKTKIAFGPFMIFAFWLTLLL